MKRARVIPVLLLKGAGLYKTVRFREERYVGDPVNGYTLFEGFNFNVSNEFIGSDSVSSPVGVFVLEPEAEIEQDFPATEYWSVISDSGTGSLAELEVICIRMWVLSVLVLASIRVVFSTLSALVGPEVKTWIFMRNVSSEAIPCRSGKGIGFGPLGVGVIVAADGTRVAVGTPGIAVLADGTVPAGWSVASLSMPRNGTLQARLAIIKTRITSQERLAFFFILFSSRKLLMIIPNEANPPN